MRLYCHYYVYEVALATCSGYTLSQTSTIVRTSAKCTIHTAEAHTQLEQAFVTVVATHV